MIVGNQEKSHFSNTGKILLKQEFSDGYKISKEHKRYYYTFDNSLLFTESISEHYTNLSTLNHNVRFLPCQHRGVGIMQYVYAKPCVHRFCLFPDTPAEKFPVRAVDIVNPGIQRRFIAPDIH